MHKCTLTFEEWFSSPFISCPDEDNAEDFNNHKHCQTCKYFKEV